VKRVYVRQSTSELSTGCGRILTTSKLTLTAEERQTGDDTYSASDGTSSIIEGRTLSRHDFLPVGFSGIPGRHDFLPVGSGGIPDRHDFLPVGSGGIPDRYDLLPVDPGRRPAGRLGNTAGSLKK
jgi:hypothetical protein